MDIIEVVGIVASLLIILSMSFKTSTYKGGVCMRSINIIGSAVFVVYGALLPAISTAFLNGVLVLVNLYHLIVMIKKHKNDIKNS